MDTIANKKPARVDMVMLYMIAMVGVMMVQRREEFKEEPNADHAKKYPSKPLHSTGRMLYHLANKAIGHDEEYTRRKAN